MSAREDWQFPYTVEQIHKAANERSLFHEERLAYWEAELEDVRTSIESSGISLKEYDVTGGKRYDVQIEPTLLKRLQESQEKISHHQVQAKSYDQWAIALSSRPSAETIWLDHEDILYFGPIST